MTISTGFLLYVTLYRLTVLAIGALSIYLGFRLFDRSLSGQNRASDTASANVEAGDFKLNLTDFWPGTYFALFGTVLICIMLWQGAPLLTLQDIKESTDSGTKTTKTVKMRVDPAVHLGGSPRQAGNLDGEADIDREWKQLNKPGLSLSEAALPLSDIARIWQRENRIGEAVAMARLAYLYGANEDKTEHLALFAELLAANGNEQRAAEARAALAEMRERTDRQEK